MNSDNSSSTGISQGTAVPEDSSQRTNSSTENEPMATAVAPSMTEAPNGVQNDRIDHDGNVPSATAVAPSSTSVPSPMDGSEGADSPSATAVAPSSTAVSSSSTAVPPSTTSTSSSASSATSTSSASSPSSASSANRGNNGGSSSRFGGASQNGASSTGLNKSEAPTLSEYVIGGNRFKVVRLISALSGESKVFLVENGGNQYVLKLYHATRHPNHQILDIVASLKGSNLVVDIFDHGQWIGDDGRPYDYELMRYYSGRPLSSISFRGNEDRLKELVPRMAAAIDYCHRHNILHRDIKPANFIFTDQTESDLVLMDFGIGKLMDNNRRTTTDDGRTPLYAAPEMYTYIPGRPTYVSTPSDYFALGMTLLSLWEGEGVLTADEGKLLRDKQEETLPYPPDMSDHMLSLVKGLTRRNPDNRADFDAIVRWCNGEMIYRDRDTDGVNTNFRIVFSADDNLIAHSAKELGQMMWLKKDLAKRYLYQDMISRWLNDAERPELSLRMEEITEHQYPLDKDSGLYAACLFLNPDMGFECVNGSFVHDKEGLANELFNNSDHYANKVVNSSHPVWIFLRQIGKGELADKYPDIIRNRDIDGYRTLCYALSPNIPYVFADKRGNTFYLSNLNDLQKALQQKKINQNNIDVLASPSFRVWLAGQDSSIIDKLQHKINSGDSASKIGWMTAYLIAPNLDYNFNLIQSLEQSDCFTLEQLLLKVAKQINDPTKYGTDLASQWQSSYFNSSRLCQYLLSKDKYDNQVQYITKQLSAPVWDKTPRYGHYNQRVVRMKAIAGLLGGKYPLEMKGKGMTDLRGFEANKDSLKTLSSADDELLTDWLALSFSEDPMVDYNKKSYQGLVKNMIDYMVTNCPNSRVATKVKAYRAKLNDAKKTYKKTVLGVKLMRWAAILFCFIPMLAIFCTSIYVMLTADPEMFDSFMENVGNVAGWVIGIIVGIWGISETGLVSGIVIGGLAGWGTKAVCLWAAPAVAWIWVALLAIIIIIFAKRIFVKIPIKLTNKWSTMSLSQSESLGEIAEAFGHRNKLLPNLPTDYPMCVYNRTVSDAKASTKKLMKTTLIIFLITGAVIALSVYVNNTYRHYAEGGIPEEVVVHPGDVAGYYEGIVNGTPATLVLTQTDTPSTTVLRGKITTKYSTVLEHNVVGQFTSMDKTNLVLKVINGDGMADELRQYITTVDYSDGNVQLSGNYDNRRKKTNHSFNFTKKE